MAQPIVINPDGSITPTSSQQTQSGSEESSSPTYYDTDNQYSTGPESDFDPSDSSTFEVEDVTTSTGDNGGSESPPDNGGYENPPRPDRTPSGPSSAGNDPVSGGGFFSDLPTLGDIREGLDISDNPNISSEFGGGGGSLFGDIQEGLDISDNPNISSEFGGGGGSLFGGDSIISNITGGGGNGGGGGSGDGGGTDSSDVGGFSVPPIFRDDENYSAPDPDEPAIDGGPQWFTIGLAAVAALGAGLLIAGRD